MLPDGSGFDVCRRIREHSDVPVLFLSARGEDEDKLRGLALGADDYIVKSATPAEVVARVKAVLRRSARADARRHVYGRFAIDRDAHEVTADGHPVALTAREFELLELFMEHPRQVLSREQIYERAVGLVGRPARGPGLRAPAAREARAGADRDGVGRRLPVRSAVRSLRTWLALGLAAAIVAARAAGLGAWVLAGRLAGPREQGRFDDGDRGAGRPGRYARIGQRRAAS